MAMPKPVLPKRLVVEESSWLKASNSLGRNSLLMPMPVSRITKRREDLPLKHDGYVVEELAAENGERSLVVKAATERAFLYANYESNRWMNAEHYPFVRDPYFKFRALDVSRSPESLKEWIAATGANAVYLKRGRPDAKRLRECAALGVPAYGFLYGCDAAKWNREKYDGYVAAHPSARGVTPPKSWEKGTMCPSDPATREFFKNAVREIADVLGIAGVVVCLWDDYGLNCVCDRCRSNGFAGNWGRQVAFAVRAWEDALKSVGKKLIGVALERVGYGDEGVQFRCLKSTLNIADIFGRQINHLCKLRLRETAGLPRFLYPSAHFLSVHTIPPYRQ